MPAPKEDKEVTIRIPVYLWAILIGAVGWAMHQSMNTAAQTESLKSMTQQVSEVKAEQSSMRGKVDSLVVTVALSQTLPTEVEGLKSEVKKLQLEIEHLKSIPEFRQPKPSNGARFDVPQTSGSLVGRRTAGPVIGSRSN